MEVIGEYHTHIYKSKTGTREETQWKLTFKVKNVLRTILKVLLIKVLTEKNFWKIARGNNDTHVYEGKQMVSEKL